MAIRPDSSKSESVTVRVPRELMEQARSIVSGGNSLAVLTALRMLCGESIGESSNAPIGVLREITERLTALESMPYSVSSGDIQERITGLDERLTGELKVLTDRVASLEVEVSSLKKSRAPHHDRSYKVA